MADSRSLVGPSPVAAISACWLSFQLLLVPMIAPVPSCTSIVGSARTPVRLKGGLAKLGPMARRCWQRHIEGGMTAPVGDYIGRSDKDLSLTETGRIDIAIAEEFNVIRAKRQSVERPYDSHITPGVACRSDDRKVLQIVRSSI